MPLDRLVEWWNAVYSLPLAFVLVFLTITSAVSLVGGAFGDLGHGHGDADADADVDADLDVDADVDADLDTDVEHDADVHTGDGHAHHGHGHHGHGHHGPLVGTLVLLGAGQAPVMLLLQILLLFWGLIGLCLHSALGVRSPTGLLWSVPLTLVLSVLGTRTFAAVFGRYFKQYESSAVRRNQLVGRTGRVVYPVTLDEGTVSVRDEHGTLHRVRARSRHAALDCGQEIVVLAYDPERNLYDVDDAVAFVDRP